MPIAPAESINFSVNERRQAHGEGSSIYFYVKQAHAEIPAIVQAREFLTPVASFTTTASTLYARFLGRATGAKPLTTINVVTSGTASNGVTSTVGFATSAIAPAGVGQTLTCQAVGTVVTTGSAGNKASTAIAYTPPAGSYIWQIHHVSTGTTQPTLWALGGEIGEGLLQVKTSQVAAPTVGATFVMTLPTPALTAQVPYTFIS
jgi:hypothetical protein